MELLHWLLERSDHPEREMPPLRDDLRGKPVDPSSDPEDHGGDEEDYLDLEPVYTVIDYCDSKGDGTRRRITMRRLCRGPHAPLLKAVCHERRALRSFRCDRIEFFIDDDGVITETIEFFRDVMDIDLSTFGPSNAQRRQSQARDVRDTLRPMLSLLLAAGRSDGFLHPEELDVILRYAEDELFDLADAGDLKVAPTLDLVEQMVPVVERMRPQRDTISSDLAHVISLPERRFSRFGKALEAVIIADGHLAPGELGFLDEMRLARNGGH